MQQSQVHKNIRQYAEKPNEWKTCIMMMYKTHPVGIKTSDQELAPGPDGFTTDIYKVAGKKAPEIFLTLINTCLNFKAFQPLEKKQL